MGLNFIAPAPFATIDLGAGVIVSADANALISNVQPNQQSALVAAGCAPIAFNPLANFRNLLDGGDFTTNPFQRNIPGLASAGVIAAPISTTPGYFPDRWFAAGAASTAILMAAVADTTVPGFSTSLFLSRQSGSTSTATISVGQVLETADSIRTQGQTVTLSFWARTGANYSGGALTAQIVSGKGSNQSAATLVSGSWTAQAAVASSATSISGAMTRYSLTGVVPVGATQLGVLISFSPTSTAGAADGVYLNGVQLEIGGMSPFEHRDAQVELEIAQRYAWVIAEPANGVLIGSGTTLGANSQNYYLATPVQFFKAPTVTVSPGSFKVAVAAAYAAAASLAAGTTHTPNAISLTSANTAAAGVGALLGGGGGSGYIVASADF